MSTQAKTKDVFAAMREIKDDTVQDFLSYLDKNAPFVYKITPSLADHIRTTCGGRNRNLSRPHVNRLALAMKNGEWRYNNASIGFFEDGKLSDGQHRLAACIEAQFSFTTLVVPGMALDSILTVDQQVKKRASSDFLNMMGMDNADTKAFIASNYLKYTSGDRGFNGPSPSNMAVKQYLDNHGDELDDYIDEATELMKSATNKTYNVKSAALWLFVADKNSPHYKKEARQVLTEIITGISDNEASPGLVASSVLTKMAERRTRETLNMNRRIGTTIKALNLTIAGKKASPKAVKYPAQKGERFPSLIS